MNARRRLRQSLAVGVALALAVGLSGDKRVSARPVFGRAEQSASLEQTDAHVEKVGRPAPPRRCELARQQKSQGRRSPRLHLWPERTC